MEKVNALLSIDFNFILIALIAIFYSLEQLVSTQFKFNNRTYHLLPGILS